MPTRLPSDRSDASEVRWLRISARGIALVWGGFWTWFGLNAALDRGMEWSGVAVQAAVPGLFFLALALVPWKWEGAGGLFLMVEALVVAVGYPIMVGTSSARTVLFVELTMALPPLAAGALFVQVWRKTRPRGGPPG